MTATNSPSSCTYPISIPSIWDKHNHLTRKHGFVDLDQAIRAGDQVDENEINKAWALVKYLEAIAELEVDSTITKAVITTAKVRAKAIDQAIINAHCGVVQTSSVVLEDGRRPQLHELDGSDPIPPLLVSPSLSQTDAPQPGGVSQKRPQGGSAHLPVPSPAARAEAANLCIRWRNNKLRDAKAGSNLPSLEPIQKTVPGNGLSFINKLSPGHNLRSNHPHISLMQSHGNAYTHAEIGSTPPSFRPDPSAWLGPGPNYILTLVYFYNMDFGLKQGETPAEWRRKVADAFSEVMSL